MRTQMHASPKIGGLTAGLLGKIFPTVIRRDWAESILRRVPKICGRRLDS